jgi:hypothetical protein
VCLNVLQATQTKWRSFEKAREFARFLGLKSKKEWQEWRASGDRPDDIPSAPDQTYHDEGWLSWPDWLGYGEGRVGRWEFRSFEEARKYVRCLGLTDHKEWFEWSASGDRPDDIPSNPDQTYHDDGWLSHPDWLGYGEGRVGRRRTKLRT